MAIAQNRTQLRFMLKNYRCPINVQAYGFRIKQIIHLAQKRNARDIHELLYLDFLKFLASVDNSHGSYYA